MWFKILKFGVKEDISVNWIFWGSDILNLMFFIVRGVGNFVISWISFIVVIVKEDVINWIIEN